MEIKMHNYFTLKHHSVEGEIIFRELKIMMAFGWKRRKIWLRWQLTILMVCLM